MYSVRYGSGLRLVWGCFPSWQEAERHARGLACSGHTATVFTPAGHYFGTFRPGPAPVV